MFPLLRLADFCGAPRWVLAKTGARLRVAVAQICGAGHSPLAHLDGGPCSASPVSAAGSGSAAQPAAAPCFVHWTRSPPLLRVILSAPASVGGTGSPIRAVYLEAFKTPRPCLAGPSRRTGRRGARKARCVFAKNPKNFRRFVTDQRPRRSLHPHIWG